MKDCPYCNQHLPEGLKPKLKNKAGRRGSVDYDAIKKLHASGMSIRKIAKTLGYSTYSVFCGTRK